MTIAVAICICVCVAIFAVVHVHAQSRLNGFQPTDFIVTSSFGGRNPVVYYENLTFKHVLDDSFSDGQYPTAFDVAVSSSGLAALIGQGGSMAERLRIYRANGSIACSVDFQFGAPLDVAATSSMVYVPGVGVQERDLRDCALVRTLAPNSTVSGCDVSLTRLFAGVGGGNVEVYDLATGALITTFVADNGQRYAGAIDYSAATNTILIGDGIANRIFERNASNGQLVRFFDGAVGMDSGGMVERMLAPEGITRGPNNTVYVCDRIANIVRVYTSTAQLLANVTLSQGPCAGIAWVGGSGINGTTTTATIATTTTATTTRTTITPTPKSTSVTRAPTTTLTTTTSTTLTASTTSTTSTTSSVMLASTTTVVGVPCQFSEWRRTANSCSATCASKSGFETWTRTVNDMTECVGLLSEMRACTASGCDTLATETETTMTLESDPTQLAAPTTDIAIIGGAVGGGVAVFCLVCVAVLVMMRSRRQRDVVHTSNNVKLAPPNTTSIYGFVPPQTQLSATTNQYSEGVLQPDSTAYATLRLSQPEGISEYVAR